MNAETDGIDRAPLERWFEERVAGLETIIYQKTLI